MRREIYTSMVILLGTLVLTTGCATKKLHQKDVANLQSQIGTLQGEIARLDQSVRDSELALRAVREGGAARPAGTESIFGETTGGPIYRTPSGFELPALAIQQALKKAGYYQGAIDGKIGSATKQALRDFQRDNGLVTDGVCGRQTWARLKSFA